MIQIRRDLLLLSDDYRYIDDYWQIKSTSLIIECMHEYQVISTRIWKDFALELAPIVANIYKIIHHYEKEFSHHS